MEQHPRAVHVKVLPDRHGAGGLPEKRHAPGVAAEAGHVVVHPLQPEALVLREGGSNG